MRPARWLAGLSVLVALVYLYFSWLAPLPQVPDHPYFQTPAPWVVAHQGGGLLRPANTMAAFEHAYSLGVDVLEMDVRVAGDDTLVIIHDPTVDRTTDGTGAVSAMTPRELRELDAGYTFEDASGNPNYRGHGVRVPLLAEVLERFEDARFNLEMKSFTVEDATRFCEQLKRSGATERTLVASFTHEPMERFRRDCPAVATSATSREGYRFYLLHKLGLESLFDSPATALQVPEVAPFPFIGPLNVVSPSMLEVATKMNVRVQVWTVNEEAAMRRLLGLYVHAILTDRPDRLLRILGSSRASDEP